MTLRKNIDKKAYGISQTLWDKNINFMLIFNAKGFSMTVCTLGEILPYMTSLSVGNLSPDVQRPGSGVVRLVLTHWLT